MREEMKAWMTWGTRALGKKRGTGIASSADPYHPYHPDYGMPNDTRLRALRLAESIGVKAAAAECNVAEVTIYRWRKDYASSASST